MADDTKRLPADQSESDKHRQSLLNMLVDLRHNKELCDVIITVENKEFHAHKNILSASSDYFRSMFTSEFQEKTQDEVELDGTSASFERLLEFAYSGHLKLEDLSTADAIDTLNMAAYLQVILHPRWWGRGEELHSNKMLQAAVTTKNLVIRVFFVTRRVMCVRIVHFQEKR